MSILLLIVNLVLLFPFVIYSVTSVSSESLSSTIIDHEVGDVDVLVPCSIDRSRWTLPSILQWYRSNDHYSKPIASQFDNYPEHVDILYRDRYRLLLNGSLNLGRVQLNDNDTFECRLILIDRGLLDVKEKYSVTLRVNEPPRFINQSDALQIVSHYSTVYFICHIYAVPTPTITWYKVAKKPRRMATDEHLELLSIDSQRLTLYNVDDRMAGKYRCVGQNRLGSIHHDFQLLIQGSIYWRQFPESQTIRINDSLTLKCEGESSELLQYQWLKDDLPLSDTMSSQDRIRTYSDGLLHIPRVEPSDHGAYVCIISTFKTASVRSKPATVTIKYPPMPSRNRPPENLTLIRGSKAICPCALDAFPPIESVSWYRDGVAIRIESRVGAYTINSDYALVISSVGIDDHGVYLCRAQNSEGFGLDSKPFHVETKEPIQFSQKPNSMYEVHERDRLVVPCVAFGSPQPTIRWFKNSYELNAPTGNLTMEEIKKSDHGLYVCQASNKHTTTNMTTFIVVKDTTPQAPRSLQCKQRSSNLFLSWEPGYDGGRSQHFMVWYRNANIKKRHWNQIRVLPRNTSEFLLLDLKLRQIYELTIVAENELGLGSFSSIMSIQLNDTEDASIGYLHQSNETTVRRPSSPVNLRLSHSGSNLYITWNHPMIMDSSTTIFYYVIQWRSTIHFNNQQSQQSMVVQYPARSFILKDVKQSNYIVQIISYSNRGIYSSPIESQINIRFTSMLAYSGSNRLLVSLLGILILLSAASVCVCLVCSFKYYYHRRSYCTDLECNSKLACGCCPRIRYRLGDCSHVKVDRYRASLLKSNDLSTTPLYLPHHRLASQTPTASMRPPSPHDNYTDSAVALAKVTTIPRCRDSVTSNISITALSARAPLSTDTSHGFMSPALTFPASEEARLTSFFESTSTEDVSYGDLDTRKNGSRLPLEVVPEMSELDTVYGRYGFDPTSSSSSTLPHSHHPRSFQPSPILITFDSGSLKRRT